MSEAPLPPDAAAGAARPPADDAFPAPPPKPAAAPAGGGGGGEHVREMGLLVAGMSRASCVALIESALLSLDGVSSASVSLMGKSAKVEYDERRIDVLRIIEKVAAAGYAAEPTEDDAALSGATDDGETRRWRRLFVGSCAFTLPVFLISMVLNHLPTIGDALAYEVVPGLNAGVLVLWLLTTPVQSYYALAFYRGAYAALRHRNFNMDVLVVLGTSAAYIYSVVFIVVALATAGAQGRGNEQFETAAMLITFILLGKWLETSAKGRASQAIAKLLTLQPPTALQLISCKELDREPHEVPVSGLRKGDVVKVLPGAQVPVDGSVLFGASAVDESMITGESLPQPKRANDRVVGGINGGGLLQPDGVAPITLPQIMRSSSTRSTAPQIQFADRSARLRAGDRLRSARGGVEDRRRQRRRGPTDTRRRKERTRPRRQAATRWSDDDDPAAPPSSCAVPTSACAPSAPRWDAGGGRWRRPARPRHSGQGLRRRARVADAVLFDDRDVTTGKPRWRHRVGDLPRRCSAPPAGGCGWSTDWKITAHGARGVGCRPDRRRRWPGSSARSTAAPSCWATARGWARTGWRSTRGRRSGWRASSAVGSPSSSPRSATRRGGSS